MTLKRKNLDSSSFLVDGWRHNDLSHAGHLEAVEDIVGIIQSIYHQCLFYFVAIVHYACLMAFQ
jgi:hypothetical protein